MRIEFDPTNPDEAAAVRAMLTAMRPTAPRYDPTARSATFIAEEKVHSEDGGMTVNLTDGTITVASDTTTVPDLDANGEPWDARIHSTPAKTNADGTWRAKRGVKAEEIAAVRAEREQAPTAQEAEMIDPANAVHDTVQEQSAPPAPNAPVEEPTVSAPTPPAPPSAPPSPAPVADAPQVTLSEPSFLDVMKAITAAQKDGHVTTAKVKELCAAIGAGDSTMGLNGADKGEHRQLFLQVLGLEPEARDAIIAAAQGEPGIDTVRALLGGA